MEPPYEPYNYDNIPGWLARDGHKHQWWAPYCTCQAYLHPDALALYWSRVYIATCAERVKKRVHFEEPTDKLECDEPPLSQSTRRVKTRPVKPDPNPDVVLPPFRRVHRC